MTLVVKENYWCCRFNSRWSNVKTNTIATRRTVNRKCLFHHVSEAQIADLKEEKMKKYSFAKMNWAVNAYREWCESRLDSDFDYDEKIFKANLDDVANITKQDLEYALCRLIPVVRKKKGVVIFWDIHFISFV